MSQIFDVIQSNVALQASALELSIIYVNEQQMRRCTVWAFAGSLCETNPTKYHMLTLILVMLIVFELKVQIF